MSYRGGSYREGCLIAWWEKKCHYFLRTLLVLCISIHKKNLKSINNKKKSIYTNKLPAVLRWLSLQTRHDLYGWKQTFHIPLGTSMSPAGSKSSGRPLIVGWWRPGLVRLNIDSYIFYSFVVSLWTNLCNSQHFGESCFCQDGWWLSLREEHVWQKILQVTKFVVLHHHRLSWNDGRGRWLWPKGCEYDPNIRQLLGERVALSR